MSISSHIDDFNKLIVDLLNLDETFKDERKAMLLIGSLIDDLNHLCINLVHGKNKLLNYEIQKKDQREHQDESVKASRGRRHSKKNGKKEKSEIPE